MSYNLAQVTSDLDFFSKERQDFSVVAAVSGGTLFVNTSTGFVPLVISTDQSLKVFTDMKTVDVLFDTKVPETGVTVYDTICTLCGITCISPKGKEAFFYLLSDIHTRHTTREISTEPGQPAVIFIVGKIPETMPTYNTKISKELGMSLWIERYNLEEFHNAQFFSKAFPEFNNTITYTNLGIDTIALIKTLRSKLKEIDDLEDIEYDKDLFLIQHMGATYLSVAGIITKVIYNIMKPYVNTLASTYQIELLADTSFSDVIGLMNKDELYNCAAIQAGHNFSSKEDVTELAHEKAIVDNFVKLIHMFKALHKQVCMNKDDAISTDSMLILRACDDGTVVTAKVKV